MMLIHYDNEAWVKLNDTERQRIFGEYMQLVQEMESRGKYLGGDPLHPTTAATSVRIRNGKRLITDGPFAETREQLGGYMLVDAGDLDEAMAIATRIPAARYGTVEVRPVMELEEHFGVPTPTTA